VDENGGPQRLAWTTISVQWMRLRRTSPSVSWLFSPSSPTQRIRPDPHPLESHLMKHVSMPASPLCAHAPSPLTIFCPTSASRVQSASGAASIWPVWGCRNGIRNGNATTVHPGVLSLNRSRLHLLVHTSLYTLQKRYVRHARNSPLRSGPGLTPSRHRPWTSPTLLSGSSRHGSSPKVLP
jgi:hypothetical protein